MDEFKIENEVLILAAVELSSKEPYFDLPVWISEEVTQD